MRTILTILALLATLATPAQQSLDTLSVKVFFRQDKHVIDPAYRNNARNLADFCQRYAALKRDKNTLVVGTLSIVAGASPEASIAYNKALAERRAASIRAYLRQHLDTDSTRLTGDIATPDKSVQSAKSGADNTDNLSSIAIGIDWPGLRRLVAALPPAARYRNRILYIIDNTPEWDIVNGLVVETRKQELTRLAGGAAWRYIYDNLFPELRATAVTITYSLQPRPRPLPPLPQASLSHCTFNDSVPRPIMPPPPTQDTLYIALRTNALYDLALVPSLGIEVLLGRHWAVSALWQYAWWKCDHRHHYWRLNGGDITVRRYFAGDSDNRCLGRPQGWYAGAYAQMGTYDFCTGERGVLAPKWSYAAGLEIGYQRRIARRWNISAAIGLGYNWGEYYRYHVDHQSDCYVYEATRNRHWLGPTKAELSFVYLLPFIKKGGRQ